MGGALHSRAEACALQTLVLRVCWSVFARSFRRNGKISPVGDGKPKRFRGIVALNFCRLFQPKLFTRDLNEKGNPGPLARRRPRGRGRPDPGNQSCLAILMNTIRSHHLRNHCKIIVCGICRGIIIPSCETKRQFKLD